MEQRYKEGDFSIGWFKLALLVSRGEKEKALSLHRLLAFSFDDKAYTLQIEGDLLWAFDDKAALTKYEQAAMIYKSEKKCAASLGIYEHLLALDSYNLTFLMSILELSIRLEWYDHVARTLEKLAGWIKKNRVSAEQVNGLLPVIFEALYECGNEHFIRSIVDLFSEMKKEVPHIDLPH